jgi:ABC-type uncharacterized transport system YnjBCD ATPase subunit
MTQTNEPAPQTGTGGLSEPTDGAATDPFLVVEDLTVKFPTADGLVQAVTGLSYSVEQGKTLGIVGESGSGKSVSSLAVMGLHDAKRTQMSGSIRVGGKEVLGLANDKMRRIRGREVAMIFQDPLTALHPFYKVGAQISEAYRAHHDVSKSVARTIVFKHALRAAMVPVVTIFGLDLATLLAGTIFAERIFSIEGIGKWGLDAVTVKNLPVVSATVLVASVAVVLANLLVDLVYSVLDPRVRLT